VLGINKAPDEFNQKQKGAGDANEKIRQDAKSASEARQKELDARLAAIKAEQQHKLDELGAGKPDPDAAAAEAASAAAAAEAERQRRMQEAQAGVDAAQAEFQAALADARQENAPAPDLTDVTGEAAKARALANLAAEGEGISPGMIGAGLERAQRTVDISGGFNAAAFKGLGVGDTVADHVKDQVKEQKKSNDLLGRVVRNTGQIGVANEP
jgi:DNA repair exonuclease SbcCD ATPase subunit